MISQVLKILFLTYLIAALLKQFQPHTDTINSIQLFTRSERLLVLTASSDCAVALWDVEGRHIGIFGQVGLFLNPCFQAPQCNRDILTFVALYDRFRRNNFDLQFCKGSFFSDTIFGHSIQKKKKTPPEPRIEQRFSIISSLVSRGVALQSFIIAKLRAAQAKQVFHEQDKLLPIEHTQYNLCELEFFSFACIDFRHAARYCKEGHLPYVLLI